MSDSPDRAQRFRDLFDAVVDLTPGERTAYLDRECSDDVDLHALVERLSAADEETDADVDAVFDALRAEVLVGDAPTSDADPAEPTASVAANVVVADLQEALRDRYSVERESGRGGMATVYLAHDRKHDRSVAVKVLRPDLAAAIGPERFLQEIKVTAKLNHPHILPLLDSGEADGFIYYVMPFVDGE